MDIQHCPSCHMILRFMGDRWHTLSLTFEYKRCANRDCPECKNETLFVWQSHKSTLEEQTIAMRTVSYLTETR